MKTTITIFGIFLACNAFAGAMGAQGRDDIFFYIFVIVLLGLLLLFNNIVHLLQRITLDAEYRQRLWQALANTSATLKEGLRSKRSLAQNGNSIKYPIIS